MGVNPHEIREPETLVERIAFAIAAQDITGSEGYLSDDELEGAEIIWRKCQGLCPNLHHLSSAARFFGIPEATYQRYIYKFIWLLKHERGRRDPKGKANMHADLLQAFWPDYMAAAKAAYSVILENPKALKALKAQPPGNETEIKVELVSGPPVMIKTHCDKCRLPLACGFKVCTCPREGK